MIHDKIELDEKTLEEWYGLGTWHERQLIDALGSTRQELAYEKSRITQLVEAGEGGQKRIAELERSEEAWKAVVAIHCRRIAELEQQLAGKGAVYANENTTDSR